MQKTATLTYYLIDNFSCRLSIRVVAIRYVNRLILFRVICKETTMRAESLNL